jgi:hypothetical protein
MAVPLLCVATLAAAAGGRADAGRFGVLVSTPLTPVSLGPPTPVFGPTGDAYTLTEAPDPQPGGMAGARVFLSDRVLVQGAAGVLALGDTLAEFTRVHDGAFNGTVSTGAFAHLAAEAAWVQPVSGTVDVLAGAGVAVIRLFGAASRSTSYSRVAATLSAGVEWRPHPRVGVDLAVRWWSLRGRMYLTPNGDRRVTGAAPPAVPAWSWVPLAIVPAVVVYF